MTHISAKIGLVSLALFGLFALASPCIAGGDDIDGSGVSDPEDGPPFFGVARDVSTQKVLVDAIVRAEFAKGQVIMTRTDPEGAFRFGAFGKTVPPETVQIKCAMKGYKLLDVSRRQGSGPPDTPIEVECLLEPE
ncbi:MAG: hypothetical protein JWL62_844 [Hyphomicrobiales bacterium]|nr:hypothetical protein [Hyphomicrobiales bacterium]